VKVDISSMYSVLTRWRLTNLSVEILDCLISDRWALLVHHIYSLLNFARIQYAANDFNWKCL